MSWGNNVKNIMAEENHNNQRSKEETESTKNSAIPLVLTRFLNNILQTSLMIKYDRNKRKEEKLNESSFCKKEEEEEKEQQAAMLQKKWILISHCTKAAANPVNCTEDKGHKELNTCIKHGKRGGRAHVSRRKP